MSEPAAVHESLRNQPATMPLAERVNFQSVFEGLFLTAFRDELTPELRQQLRSAGLDLNDLKAAYPHSVFLDSLKLAAAAWFPTEPVSTAYVKLGERNIEGFFQTFLGRPLLVLLKVLGPRRTLGRMRANFRSANNDVESKLVELSPTEFQLWMNEAGDIRYFIQGVVQRGVTMAGAPQLVMDVLSTDANGTVFRVRL